MSITLIVAAGENGVIGRADGEIPWHIKTDLQRYKSLTLGHPIIMGRTTHESIGRPLPGRQNIVMTRQPGYTAEGCDVVDGPDAALAIATDDDIWVIGGGKVYESFMDRADAIEFTRVHASPDGVAFFSFDESRFRLVNEEKHEANSDAGDDHAFTFQRWERF